MDRLHLIDNIIKLSFYLWFSIVFYLSLKKCFQTDGMSKIRPLILSVVTNPIVGFVISFIISSYLVSALIFDLNERDSGRGSLTTGEFLIMGVMLAITILLIIGVFVFVSSKVLKLKYNPSLWFLYLMFNTICIISFRGTGGAVLFSSPEFTDYFDIFGVITLYIASWLFYRLDILSLAGLAREKVKVNWFMFNILPALFILAYGVFMMVLVYDPSIEEPKMLILIYIFTTLIVYLFIWAFYAIIKNINSVSQVKHLSVEVMEALAHTIDAKDEYTRGHSVRVANYSRMIAEKLGLSEEECESVYYMGLLHDIGKIGVPNEIINSKSKLTDEEYDVIKTHPGVGFGILDEIKSRPDLSIGAHWHHERFDGRGYPDGKKGEDIPFFARIIAVADSYDAMTSNRSYRNYMPQEKVRSEIEKNAGSQFDPGVAKCMIEIIDEDTEYLLHE